MWVYIIVFIVLLYALYKERQALGCGNFFKGKDCNNANGKAVLGTASLPSDSTSEILDKIKYAADFDSRFVKWRAFLLISFCATVFLWFVIFKRFPPEWELLIMLLILFTTLSLAAGFYRFHLYNFVEQNIDGSVEILRNRYGTNGRSFQ